MTTRSELAEQFDEIAQSAIEEAEALECNPADTVAGLRLMQKAIAARAKELQTELRSGAYVADADDDLGDDDGLEIEGDDGEVADADE